MSERAFAALPGTSSRLLCYSAADDAWSIRWRCDDCGGVVLPLLGRPGAAGHSSWIATIAEAIRDHGCPGCEARTNRGDLDAPDVWWDPGAGGWVVRLPLGGGETVILALEIRWFDAPRALICSTAADLLYADDAFFRVEDA